MTTKMIRNETEATLVRDEDSQSGSEQGAQVKFDVISVESGISSGENERPREPINLLVKLKSPVPPDHISFNSSSYTSDFHSDTSSEVDYSLPIRRLKTPREIKLKLFVAFLFILIIVNVTLVWIFHKPKPTTLHLGNAKVVVDYGHMYVSYQSKIVLESQLAVNLPNASPYGCAGKKHKNGICLLWKGYVKLNATFHKEDAAECYSVEWISLDKNYVPLDCVSLNGAWWYGGGEMKDMKWPINSQNVSMTQYLSSDLRYESATFGSVLEPYWLSSKGISIYVDDTTPLYVSLNHNNDNNLCFQGKYEDSMYRMPDDKLSTLKYTVCAHPDINAAHQFISQEHFDTPDSYPDEHLFESPVWLTAYLGDTNQSQVLAFAEQIQEQEYNSSQLVLHDTYLLRYGDLDFDPVTFPNPADMFERLHHLGFNTAIWMHPFANTDSHTFGKGLGPGYWIRGPRDISPELTQWWHGIAAGILDVTNPKAVQWFTDKLKNLKEKLGVDSFQFVGGEVSWLPPEFSTCHPTVYPGEYTTAYTALVAGLGSSNQVRAAYRSQSKSVFLNIMEKNASWDSENGLKSIIPTVLTYSIMGYPFVIPDVIGGRGNNSLPDRELYIRWLELSAFLPVMQFLTPPWEYDQEVNDLATEWVKFHRDVIAPKMIALAQEFIMTGNPIIRPVWWGNSSDEIVYQIDTEFLIGPDTLVAPVLTKGERERDVYIPYGTWVNEITGDILTGRQWIKVDVPLGKVAYFTKS
ncbi:myogenesis-regulating glycosidase-like [Ptychodera flava]|uniref:myogenesis-regulating glycosidase-like n=1 Tax=Ptychodera flava TaxID=63121 RepID=UPI003969EA1B